MKVIGEEQDVAVNILQDVVKDESDTEAVNFFKVMVEFLKLSSADDVWKEQQRERDKIAAEFREKQARDIVTLNDQMDKILS